MADEEIAPSPDEPTPRAEPSAWVEIVPEGPICRRCGYALRGLPASGACPECGLAVARSLRGNLLEYADPIYVRRLGRGALLVELGIAAICLVPVVGMLLILVSLLVPSSESAISVAIAVGALVLIGAAVKGLVGTIMLTARDPAFIGRDRSDPSRRATRIAAITCVVCCAVMVAASATPIVASSAAFKPVQIVAMAATVALQAAMAAHTIGLLVYLGHLAERVPDLPLKHEINSTRQVAVVAASCWGAAVLLMMAPQARTVAFLLGLFGLVAILVLVTRCADATDRIRRRLRHIASASAEPRK